MAKRYELTEEQFGTIRDILPGKAGDPGRTAQDNQRFINVVSEWEPRNACAKSCTIVLPEERARRDHRQNPC